MRLGTRIRQGGGAAAISSGQHALQEVLPDRLRRAVRQMSAEPENRDRDLPMDLQETRGDVQIIKRGCLLAASFLFITNNANL